MPARNEEIEFDIIVKDEDKGLFLRDLPLFRGEERWNSFQEKAYRFDSMVEAKDAVATLQRKVDNITYELVPKEDGESLFGVELLFTEYSSTSCYWRTSSNLAALDMALALAKRSKGGLKSITITPREKD